MKPRLVITTNTFLVSGRAKWPSAAEPPERANNCPQFQGSGHELYRTTVVLYCGLQGSGHELYGGFPGYGTMLLNGLPNEQALPAAGLGGHGGLGPTSPGLPSNLMAQGIPPHYNGSYHPSFMPQNLQVKLF